MMDTSSIPISKYARPKSERDGIVYSHVASVSTSDRNAFLDTHHRASPKARPLRYYGFWWRELLTLVPLIGACIAIAATILPFDGKSLPEWPFHLSINTLISIYVAILKTSMLFVVAQGIGQLKWSWFSKSRPLHDVVQYDLASRNSIVGSFRLIGLVRHRSILAIIGAIITVAALILDPISQQIVRYHDCRVDALNSTVAPQAAYVPYANIWTNPTGIHIGAGLDSLSFDMLGAINSGYFNPGLSTLDPNTYQCSTGNCTFSHRYATVGIRSDCQDLTNTVQKHPADGPDLGDMRRRQGSTSPFWNYTLPSGTNVSEPTRMRVVPRGWSYDILYGQSELSSDNSSASNSSYRDTTLWSAHLYGAASCTLTPCVYEMEGSIHSGKIDETVTSVSEMKDWSIPLDKLDPSGTLTTLYVPCLNSTVRSKLRAGGFNVADDDKRTWMPYNYTNPPKDPSIPAECAFGYGYYSLSALNMKLASFLTGFYIIAPEVVGGTDQMQSLAKSGGLSYKSVSDTWKGMASSMTLNMRTTTGHNTTQGRAQVVTTCVEVRWSWISLSVILTGLTVLFFFSMMFVTAPYTGHDYKADVLPLMFNGLSLPRMGDGVMATGRRHDISEEAKRRMVRFDASNGNWRFIEGPGRGEIVH